MSGKQPYSPDKLMKRHIGLVANTIGFHKRIGVQTFRHNFDTPLETNG